MKRLLASTTIVAGALFFGTVPGFAAPLLWNGVSYTLEGQIDTVNPLVEHFALLISGINGAADTEKQRSGVNGIAFNEVHNGATASGTMLSPATGFSFVLGGLNSGGCVANPNPNFYCFDNVNIPPTPTTDFAANSSLKFVFDVTLNAGNSWTGYHPDFKIDWVGHKTGGYSLVSQPIDVGAGCPDCVINPTADVPEPASFALLGMGLLGMVAARRSFPRTSC